MYICSLKTGKEQGCHSNIHTLGSLMKHFYLDQGSQSPGQGPLDGHEPFRTRLQKQQESVHARTSPLAWAVGNHVCAYFIYGRIWHTCPPLPQMELHMRLPTAHIEPRPPLPLVRRTGKVGELWFRLFSSDFNFCEHVFACSLFACFLFCMKPYWLNRNWAETKLQKYVIANNKDFGNFNSLRLLYLNIELLFWFIILF